MGVDMRITVEVERYDDGGDFLRDVCDMYAGRFYHWADALSISGREGVITFASLKRRKDRHIFDGTVKDTDLYIIMRALAKRYGKDNVRALWAAD